MKKSINIKWHIDDVLAVRPDLSELQAAQVLHHLKRKHDANIGINWDVLEAASNFLFPE